MSDEIFKNVLEVGGLIVAGIISHVKLQGQVTAVSEKTKELEQKAEKVEERTVNAMTEMNKSIQELTIKIARMMERLDHTNKKVINLTAEGLRDLFNNQDD